MLDGADPVRRPVDACRVDEVGQVNVKDMSVDALRKLKKILISMISNGSYWEFEGREIYLTEIVHGTTKSEALLW